LDRAGGKGDACCVFDPAVATVLPDVPPVEDYADCWRGAVLCLADPLPGLGIGPHACHAGDFWLFGDAELLGKLKPVADQAHFGPYRGVGGPNMPTP
jgi:hypothetical protein